MPRTSFNRIDAWLIATSLLVSIVVAFVHCSSGAVCGNNVQEEGEACDKGPLNGVENSGCSATCQIALQNIAKLQIGISKLRNEAPGYDGAGCSELGATQQHIVLEGPQPKDEVWDCSMTTPVLNDVTPGDYKLTVTLLDKDGNALTNPVSSMTATAVKGQTAMLTLNFTQADFIKQDYIGTLFFSPQWGAASTKCDTASPAVTGYGVTLRNKMTGALVAGMSTGNRALDGTSGPCFVPSASGTPEAVANLPWGHYDISFTGYAGATLAYCKTFDVFTGPGTATPTYTLIVTTYDPDAGACP